MEEPHRIAFQDKIPLRDGEVKLVENRVRILDVSGGKDVRADHDAVGSDKVHQKAERFGIVGKIVVMESPDVLFEGTSQRHDRAPV